MLQKKQSFFIIVGASGAGKSTLLRRCYAHTWPNNLQVSIPPKYTTRKLRDHLEKLEMVNISLKDFQELNSSGEYLISYESYGEQYGFPVIKLGTSNFDTVYIQAFPMSVALKLKEQVLNKWSVYICALEANKEEIEMRLKGRGDLETLGKLDARLQGSIKSRSLKADFVINAHRDEEDCFNQFRVWMLEKLL